VAKLETVNPGWRWSPKRTFSPAVRKGNLLFISGMTATDERGELVGHDIASQARYIFQKMGEILKAAGAGFADVVQTTDYITTTDGYAATAEVRREFMTDPFPAATGVIVAGLLRDGALIEIDAVAILGD